MNQVQIYLRRVFLPPLSLVLANIHLLIAYDVPRIKDVGLSTKFRWIALQHCSPLLVQCRSIVYDAGPTLIYHRVCCILCAPTWHSTNYVSMFTRRWPFIKTALGDCTVFLTAALCWWRFNIPAAETPDNTIHWPNADVLLGHGLRRWVNIIPTKTLLALNHKYNRDYFFSEHLLNTKVLNHVNLRTWNVILQMFIRTGVQKCEPFLTHSTPISPKEDTNSGKIN